MIGSHHMVLKTTATTVLIFGILCNTILQASRPPLISQVKFHQFTINYIIFKWDNMYLVNFLGTQHHT